MSPFEEEVDRESQLALTRYHDSVWQQMEPLIKHCERRQKTAPVPVPRREMMAIELHLPDESRSWTLKYFACPVCRYHECELIRICHRGPRVPGWQTTYQIRCLNQSCRFAGPVLNSSEKVVQNWQVHSAMTQDMAPARDPYESKPITFIDMPLILDPKILE